MNFGQRLRELRESKNMSQVELAKVFSLTSATLSQYELNKRFPDEDTLNKLADYFHVSMDNLMGRKSIKENKSLVEENKKKQQSIKDRRDAEKYAKEAAPLLWGKIEDSERSKVLWDAMMREMFEDDFLDSRKKNREVREKNNIIREQKK